MTTATQAKQTVVSNPKTGKMFVLEDILYSRNSHWRRLDDDATYHVYDDEEFLGCTDDLEKLASEYGIELDDSWQAFCTAYSRIRFLGSADDFENDEDHSDSYLYSYVVYRGETAYHGVTLTSAFADAYLFDR